MTRRRADMLRSALEQSRTDAARRVPGVLDVVGLTSTPALSELAARTHDAVADATLAQEPRVVLSVADAQRLADCAAAAAAHGYPRPPLERLGDDAARLPAARSTDPVTSRAARPRVPTLRNQLGRLLVAYAAAPVGLTSEEAAAEAGIDPRAEYSKRVSELQALGYLEPCTVAGREVTRPGATGRPRLVFAPTAAGQELGDALAPAAG